MTTELKAPGAMKQPDIIKELIEDYQQDAEYVESCSWGRQIEMLSRLREGYAQTNKPAPLFIGMPNSKDFIFDGHAGASPSGAERWMTCTASLGATRAFLETLSPNQQAEFAGGSTAARQGTTAHAAAEAEALLMLGKIEQSEYDHTIRELTFEPDNVDEAYDEEMAEWIAEYGALVKQYADDGHTILVEQRLEAAIPLMTVDADGDPNIHVITGSGDTVVMPTPDEPVLAVIDLKYGSGLDVTVEENPQTRIYGLGALALLAAEDGTLPPIERIDYIIVQPRLGGIKVWSETVNDLLDWRDDVLSPALTEALGGLKAGAKFAPSEKACQWCPARGGCAALAEQRVEQAAELFDTIVDAEFTDGPGAFPETELLTDDRLGALYSQITGLTKIADDLKAELQRRLHRGVEVPGYHLVNYTPPRKWKDEAAELLKHSDLKVWKDPTLVTPTQALALVKEDEEGLAELVDLIDVPDKKPVVAPVTDRRKAWEGKPPEAMFDVEEDDDA